MSRTLKLTQSNIIQAKLMQLQSLVVYLEYRFEGFHQMSRFIYFVFRGFSFFLVYMHMTVKITILFPFFSLLPIPQSMKYLLIWFSWDADLKFWCRLSLLLCFFSLAFWLPVTSSQRFQILFSFSGHQRFCVLKIENKKSSF